MKSFHVKSIILGIGIGIVITSLVSLVYTAGLNPLERLDEKDIDRLCSMYNLIRKSEIDEGKSNSIFSLDRNSSDEAEKGNSNAVRDNDKKYNDSEANNVVNNEVNNVANNEAKNETNNVANNGNNVVGENDGSTDSDNDKSTGNKSKDADAKSNIEGNAEKSNVDSSKAKEDGDKPGTKNENNGNETGSGEKSSKKAGNTETGNKGKNSGKETENSGKVTAPPVLEPGTEVVITIRRGDLPDKIARTLYNKGLIKDMEEFKRRIRDLSLTRSIIADTYKIKAGTSVDDILKMITKD